MYSIFIHNLAPASWQVSELYPKVLASLIPVVDLLESSDQDSQDFLVACQSIADTVTDVVLLIIIGMKLNS